MTKELEGEWYLVDGEAVFWDGTKYRRFKWKGDPGLYEFQGVWYSWNGASWRKASSRQLNQAEPTDNLKTMGSSVLLRNFVTALVVILVIVLLGFGWKYFTKTPPTEIPPKALSATELVDLGCKDFNSLPLREFSAGTADKFSAAAKIDEKYRMLAVSAESFRITQLTLFDNTDRKLDPEFGRQMFQKLLVDLAVIQSFC